MEQAKGDRPLLLIGDRDPFMQQALMRALNEEFDLLFADRGEEVLEQARRARPAAVILEAMLPGLDGFRVCQCLKSDPITARIPVLFFTLLLAKERAAQVGADAFMLKPLRREALLETIYRLLGESPEGNGGL